MLSAVRSSLSSSPCKMDPDQYAVSVCLFLFCFLIFPSDFPLPINLSVWREGGTHVENVDGANSIRGDTGCCEAEICVDGVPFFPNQSYVLRATADGENVAGADSKPFKIMRQRLAIEENGNWQDPWYKDVGGRSNLVELSVKLLGPEEELITSRDVHLKVTLLYEDKTRVDNQNILKIFDDDLRETDRVLLQNGLATVRVRIGEVSLGHGGKKFVFKIEQDARASPDRVDIAPVRSKALMVRSKRTVPRRKRRRDQDTSDVHASGDDDRLRDAASWIAMAMELLPSLKWTIVDYERKPDGSLDGERPLYSICNPNDKITQLESAFFEKNLGDDLGLFFHA